MNGVLSAIIEELEASGSLVSEPRSFLAYARQHGFQNGKTAQNISVDSLRTLDRELRDRGILVFRLGKDPSGEGTAFSCGSYENTAQLPIIMDERDFLHQTVEGFIPSVPYSALHPFSLLPEFTKSSAVNLGLASGLVARGLSVEGEISVPATGRINCTFSFRPRFDLDETLTHRNGQVEVDSLFTARRDGKDSLFLVEAKASEQLESLSYHKLYYLYRALRDSIPAYMDLIPIYSRVVKSAGHVSYFVNECRFENDAVDSLSIIHTAPFQLPRGLGW